MDQLRAGARLLSKGMRGANGLVTFAGALLVARGIMRWLDGPDEELVYSKRIKPGERVTVSLNRPEI